MVLLLDLSYSMKSQDLAPSRLDRARQKLAKALLPQLAGAVDGAWAALSHRPYQLGGARKPFRCPRSARELGRIRGSWLLEMAVMKFLLDIRNTMLMILKINSATNFRCG